MHQVKILGVEGYYPTILLFDRVRSAVDQLQVDCQIILVSEMNELIDAGVDAVPALIVNNEIIFQRYVPSASVITWLLQSLFCYEPQLPSLAITLLGPNGLSNRRQQQVHGLFPFTQDAPYLSIEGKNCLPAPFIYLPEQELPTQVDHILLPIFPKLPDSKILRTALSIAARHQAVLHILQTEISTSTIPSGLSTTRSVADATQSTSAARLKFIHIQADNILNGLQQYQLSQPVDLLLFPGNTQGHCQSIQPIRPLLQETSVPLMLV